jgi:hypothetical protein
LEVRLSRELVGLLSEQLYQSPVKAIEELVVNSFDADASECRLFLPDPLEEDQVQPILVWDDGVGMDEAGLADLWHVGHSTKRTEQVEKQRKRKQIGKFGIGKLATYAIAERVTYVTRTRKGPILTTTLDYGEFRDDPTGGAEPVRLSVSEVTADHVLAEERLVQGLEVAGVDLDHLRASDRSWTLVVLEDFRPRVRELKRGRLRWVLGTAMPLGADFTVFANNEEIPSSKESYEEVVRFSVGELPEERISRLSTETGLAWTVEDGALRSDEFPSGIRGEVIVTRRSLHEGKSADLRRSHGFFVRVRERLVNLDDPLFGLAPLSFKTFNRFRADLEADDLDAAITAPREGAETTSPLRLHFESALDEIFYEARSRFERWELEQEARQKTKREDVRNYVDPRLVERPVADALIAEGAVEGAEQERIGTEADEGWFYLTIDSGADLPRLLESLYAEERTGVYRYERAPLGRSGRLVEFNPGESVFRINADHELVKAHDDEEGAQPLLEDVVTAEALLEVYLREQGLSPHAVGEVLERRDLLLRSLTRDRLYSLSAVAENLRHARDDQYDLEITLIVAARSLGFVAKHISGSGEPDGVARLVDYPTGEQKITLEAKASGKVPSLSAIDFAGLKSHMTAHDATGCLLVAPAYPGSTKEEDAQAALRAREQGVSCWTIEQLAAVVEHAESRQLSARHVLDIVRTAFSPDEVSAQVERLLSEPSWVPQGLYAAILDALEELGGRLKDRPRTVDLVAGEVSRHQDFRAVGIADVERAVGELAGASQGALVLRNDRLVLNTSVDELRRRTASLAGAAGDARRRSTFRETS